jgi:hypothetical protein
MPHNDRRHNPGGVVGGVGPELRPGTKEKKDREARDAAQARTQKDKSEVDRKAREERDSKPRPRPKPKPKSKQSGGTGSGPRSEPSRSRPQGGGGGGRPKSGNQNNGNQQRNRNRRRGKQKTDGEVTNRRGKPISEKRLRNIAADYGWAYSVLQEFPQVFQAFEQAVENSWSPQRFKAEIQDTNWFKKHSDQWRQSEYLRLTDPATYDKRTKEIARQIQDAAGSLGIEVPREQLAEWAGQALKFGWDQAKINNVLAKQVKITGEHTVGGSLADAQNRLETFAFANGVHVNRPTMQKWLQQIVRGNSTVEEYEEYLTKQAVAKFPNWAKELKAGMTVAEIADPYRQTMAQMLEINPANIGMNNKLLGGALSFKNDKGEYRSMSISEFEDAVRKDPRWQYTDNARETVSGITASLLQTFGAIS